MSKYVSRLISSSSILRRTPPRTIFQNSLRYQGTADPVKGKGPISWRNLGVVTIGGAGIMGFFYYVKNEKEIGKCCACY